MPVTNYIWDVVSDNVLMEKDDDGETIARYVQEPSLYGEVISQERAGQTRYFNYDGLGNTCELTDENQNVTDTYEYSAFGEEVARTGTTVNPFGYKGALGYYTNSDTNDIYVRERPYQPTIGRWISRDPFGFIDGPNLFVCAGNDPINNSDPTGLLKVSLTNPWGSIAGCDDGIWFFYKFTLSAPSPCQFGYFFQHIKIYSGDKTCPGCGDCSSIPNPKLKSEYYEWFDRSISKGETDFPSQADRDAMVDDRRVRHIDGHCGNVRFDAEVRFYCSKDLPWSGSPPKRRPFPFVAPLDETGLLPGSYFKPEFWKKKPVESAKWEFEATYHCCLTQYFAFPLTQKGVT